MDESRQYVALSKHQIPTSMMEETYYYPLEELQVVSYIGENAIVWNTEEEQIKTGYSIVFLWKRKIDIKQACYSNVEKDMKKIFCNAKIFLED